MRQWLHNMGWAYFGMSAVVAITIIAGNNWTWLSFWIFAGVAIIIAIGLTVQGEIAWRRQADRDWDTLRRKVENFRKNINAMEEK